MPSSAAHYWASLPGNRIKGHLISLGRPVYLKMYLCGGDKKAWMNGPHTIIISNIGVSVSNLAVSNYSIRLHRLETIFCSPVRMHSREKVIKSLVPSLGQCSISPRFSPDRRNKLPVSRSILSTCKCWFACKPPKADWFLSESFRHMIDTTWLLLTPDCCSPDCIAHHIMTTDRKAGNIKITAHPSWVYHNCIFSRLFLTLCSF